MKILLLLYIGYLAGIWAYDANEEDDKAWKPPAEPSTPSHSQNSHTGAEKSTLPPYKFPTTASHGADAGSGQVASVKHDQYAAAEDVVPPMYSQSSYQIELIPEPHAPQYESSHRYAYDTAPSSGPHPVALPSVNYPSSTPSYSTQHISTNPHHPSYSSTTHKPSPSEETYHSVPATVSSTSSPPSVSSVYHVSLPAHPEPQQTYYQSIYIPPYQTSFTAPSSSAVFSQSHNYGQQQQQSQNEDQSSSKDSKDDKKDDDDDKDGNDKGHSGGEYSVHYIAPVYQVPRVTAIPTGMVSNAPVQPVYQVPKVSQSQQHEHPQVPELPLYKPMTAQQFPQYQSPQVPEIPKYDHPIIPEVSQYQPPKIPEIPQYERPKIPEIPQYERPKIPEIQQYESPKLPEVPQYNPPKPTEIPQYKPPSVPQLPQYNVPTTTQVPQYNPPQIQHQPPKTSESSSLQQEYESTKVTTYERPAVPSYQVIAVEAQPASAAYPAPAAPVYVEENYPDDLSAIPGQAGHDYPMMSIIPQGQFTCRDKLPGYYADIDSKCQVWHFCDMSGRKESFLCPNGTLYNQEKFVCDWWYNVNCDIAANYFILNEGLYKVPVKQSPEPPTVQYQTEVQQTQDSSAYGGQQSGATIYGSQQQQQQGTSSYGNQQYGTSSHVIQQQVATGYGSQQEETSGYGSQKQDDTKHHSQQQSSSAQQQHVSGYESQQHGSSGYGSAQQGQSSYSGQQQLSTDYGSRQHGTAVHIDQQPVQSGYVNHQSRIHSSSYSLSQVHPGYASSSHQVISPRHQYVAQTSQSSYSSQVPSTVAPVMASSTTLQPITSSSLSYGQVTKVKDSRQEESNVAVPSSY